MEIEGRDLPNGTDLRSEVAVIGAGAAGIVTALELAKAGRDVVLIESGGARFNPGSQRLGDEAQRSAEHVPMSMATRRQLGGATVVWGGRCVPFDPADFDKRDSLLEWPVDHEELLQYLPGACDWLACGRPLFDAQELPELAGPTLVPGLPDGDVRTSALERWSLPTNFGRHYRTQLRQEPSLRLLLNLTCTRIVLGEGGSGVDRLEIGALDGRRLTVRARRYVLACGGLETTRLLMASGVGDHSGHLGRWYMAHVQGTIANVRFATPPDRTIYGHERDADGVYVRRRFSFSRRFLHEQQLPSFAAWLVNPEIGDPAHRSGILSFVYLALGSRAGRYFASQTISEGHLNTLNSGPVREHVHNVVREPTAVARFAASFGYRRFLKRGRRPPGFSTYSPANVYPLQYQGEHMPQWDSRVTLDDEVDQLGVPRLRTHLRFGSADVDGIVSAHRHIDDYLRRHGCGKLEYVTDDLEARVRDQLYGGYHQAGTTRMSARPEDGVVDRNLAVHNVGNLHVASSSAFVTSSHANSTMMIIVLALRLADHLRNALDEERPWPTRT